MFLIVPKEESTGESVMSVEWAKANKKKWEEINRIRPNAMNALNLACIYHTLGRTAEALRAVDTVLEAIQEDPNCPKSVLVQAIFNRGMFLRAYGRFEESFRDISWAWEHEKNSSYIAMAYAEELLRLGKWEEGWEIHNRSRGTVEGAAQALGLPLECKFWDGKDHPEHLIVINEGGAGDRINYTRYLPLLTERGISWSFFCFDEFAPFYERLPWIGRERMILENEKKEFFPPPSHWTTTFCLGGPLGINPANLPVFPAPYTAAGNAFRLDNPDGKPVIGLCWSANELFQGGLKCRSLTEGQAMRLVCLTADKVHWVNLQHGHKMPFPVINIGFESWQDTAVIMEHMDAIATVDSGPLWLSLAMGKDTAVILTASEDWKFAHDWGARAYHNGPSDTPMDAEKAIDKLIQDIRSGAWPNAGNLEPCLHSHGYHDSSDMDD
jgi:hypothetical protein